MKEKNRFSGLLKHLMTVTKLKNYTLAKELQYDESYISKWANGNLLPTEKNSTKVLRDISRCIVGTLEEESREALYSEYQVDKDSDLEDAIYDNLMAEFNYVISTKDAGSAENAGKSAYYPELTLTQFMQKMHHPVLRQVRALDAIMAVDILALDRHYQMQLSLAELNNGLNANATQRNYPGVHFSMLVNLDAAEKHCRPNVVFLVNLLTNLSNVDFQLYACPQAAGKIVFAVREAYSIAGMIIDENHCMAVSASEDPQNCAAIYDRMRSMCSQEMLAVRRTSMPEMLNSPEYTNFLLARNQRWILGHVTEHFLPDSLFEQLADDYCAQNRNADRKMLGRIHMLTRSMVAGMDLQVLLFESALTNFAVTGEVDFFNTKMTLNLEQRLEYLNYISNIREKNAGMEIKLLRNGQVSDIQHIPDPTIFLSDAPCYLRLVCNGPGNNVSVVNKVQVGDLFRKFYDELWDSTSMSEEALVTLMRHAIQVVNVQIQAEE